MIRLAQTRSFRARWTADIQREWVTALLRDRPELDEARLARKVALMNKAVADCLVTGYEHLIDQLSLPDPNDRHVLAAAILFGAQEIVTTNLKDFPQETLAEFKIVPCHPDDFVLCLVTINLTGRRQHGGETATRGAQGSTPLT